MLKRTDTHYLRSDFLGQRNDRELRLKADLIALNLPGEAVRQEPRETALNLLRRGSERPQLSNSRNKALGNNNICPPHTGQ